MCYETESTAVVNYLSGVIVIILFMEVLQVILDPCVRRDVNFALKQRCKRRVMSNADECFALETGRDRSVLSC